MSILAFHNVGVSFGAIDLFTGLSASVPRKAKVGIVGPNGIGKTTLLRVLVGAMRATAGDIHMAKGTRIGYLQQEAMDAFVNQENTVYEEMLTVFADLRAQEAKLRQMEIKMSRGDCSESLLAKYGAVQESFEMAGGYEYEVSVRQVLSGLGFEPDQQHMPLHHCSGGQKTRALLARLLLEKPDLLILDEPTNHLDVEAVEWLEETLRGWEGTVLIVSHDRYFLDRVVNTIWEMTRNGLETYRGNYSAYLQQREDRWTRRDKEFEATQDRFLSELDYVKRNIARDSTSNQAKGRLRRLMRQVKAVEIAGAQILQGSWLQVTQEIAISKTKWTVLETEQHIRALQNPNPRQYRFHMRLHPARRGGNIVLRAKDLCIGYPGNLLFRVPRMELMRRERVALIGANGTGKSTFLRTLMGEVDLLDGQLHLGANLTISYFAQVYDMLDEEQSVLDELLAHQYMPLGQARDYLARFLFRGDDVFKPVRALSGGERSRLALSVLALQKGNLLLLDEPTNHLDIPAQEALEEALQHFDGTVLIVSHDRYLIDKLATQIWDLQRGQLVVHKGDYASFLQKRREEAVVVQEKRAARPRRPVAVSVSEPYERVVHVEERVEAVERDLVRLEQELLSATESQRWEEMHFLNREYQATQEKLDLLLTEWETLSS